MTKRKEISGPEVIKIPATNISIIELILTGLGEGLLVHRFGESAISEMEAKALGEAKTVKPPRDYEREFQEARYRRDGKDVFPSASIKKDVVQTTTFVDGVYQKTAKGAFFILGEYIEIESDPPEMHKAVVKIGSGMSRVAQVRIRPLYRNWKMRVPIRYDANILSAEQLIFLFVQTGFSTGIGEWTPQHNGSFGMFEISTNGNGAHSHGRN